MKEMSGRDIFWSLLLVIVLIGLAYGLQQSVGHTHSWGTPPDHHVSNFEECAAAGNPVMESYPAQCRTKDGRLFVQEIPEQKQPSWGIQDGCAVGGCSAQLCGEADEIDELVSNCEYRAEYACYQQTRCERQSNGRCGWTQTSQLESCIANAQSLDSQIEVQAE